jgi:hypothetical protein
VATAGAPVIDLRPAAGTDRADCPEREALAWLVPWNQIGADTVLAALLDDGYRIQAATQPLTVMTAEGERELVRGSLIVHSGIQPDELDGVGSRLAELSERHGVEVVVAERGLARSGIDLGSPSAAVLDPVHVAMLTGDGIRSNHAGYIWHWFDIELQQPLSMIGLDAFVSY